jgi:hypothetical protein
MNSIYFYFYLFIIHKHNNLRQIIDCYDQIIYDQTI